MLQSSITTWLKRPAAVTKADNPAPVQASPDAALEPEEPVIQPEPVFHEAYPSERTAAQHVQPSRAFSLPPLPANVELVPLTEDLMPGFKRLNSLTLPVAYGSAFYTETMTEPHHGITLMALWHTTPPSDVPSAAVERPHLVGAIRCRILSSANLYISTIGLLAPYRSYGIATHLLQSIVAKASKEHGVKCVTAHVWEANEDGLEWYEKRGFEIIGREDGYYRKLKPSGAVLMRKWIGVGDLLATSNQPT